LRENHLHVSFGIFYTEKRYCNEEAMTEQVKSAIAKSGQGDLNKLLKGGNTWKIS